MMSLDTNEQLGQPVQQHALLTKQMSSAQDMQSSVPRFADFDAFVAAQGPESSSSSGGSSSSGRSGGSPRRSPSLSPSPSPRNAVPQNHQPVPSTSEADQPAARMPPPLQASPVGKTAESAADAEVSYNPQSQIRPPSVEDADRTPRPSATDPNTISAPTLSESPSLRRSTSASASSSHHHEDGVMRFALVNDLAPLVLPTPPEMPGSGAPGVRLWSGWLEMPGMQPWRAELQSLQGAADLSSVACESTINVKGKLGTAALEDFLEQLMASRSRTVSVGVLKVQRASLEDAARAGYDEVPSPSLPLNVLSLHLSGRSLAHCADCTSTPPHNALMQDRSKVAAPICAVQSNCMKSYLLVGAFQLQVFHDTLRFRTAFFSSHWPGFCSWLGTFP
jgi:hypothetical protein